MFVTAMREVLDQDPPEEEEEEVEENVEESEKLDKMKFLGMTLDPIALNATILKQNSNSPFYRIECLRVYLERELGPDVSIALILVINKSVSINKEYERRG